MRPASAAAPPMAEEVPPEELELPLATEEEPPPLFMILRTLGTMAARDLHDTPMEACSESRTESRTVPSSPSSRSRMSQMSSKASPKAGYGLRLRSLSNFARRSCRTHQTERGRGEIRRGRTCHCPSDPTAGSALTARSSPEARRTWPQPRPGPRTRRRERRRARTMVPRASPSPSSSPPLSAT